jgi:hypothetical protein
MTSSFWRIVVAMIVVAAAAESESLACSCMSSGPPCQAAWAVDVIFVGTVVSIQPIERDPQPGSFRSTLVKFSIGRVFRGAMPEQPELVTNPASTCDYRFILDEKYLVYARKAGSQLSTSVCSRTRPFEEAVEDIRYLTMVGAASQSSRVYGRVTEWRRDPAEHQAVDYGPVEGIPVSVRGDSFVRDAVTDTDGRFEITGLPVGKATLTSVAPAGYEPAIFEHEIEIRDPRACSHVDISIHPTARASGVVVDSAGRPASGISIDAVAAELAGFAPPAHQMPVKTDDHGVFEFEDLPPGVYVFGMNLTTRSEGTSLFLPGTRLASEAKVIELRPGDRRDVGVLRLTQR